MQRSIYMNGLALEIFIVYINELIDKRERAKANGNQTLIIGKNKTDTQPVTFHKNIVNLRPFQQDT